MGRSLGSPRLAACITSIIWRHDASDKVFAPHSSTNGSRVCSKNWPWRASTAVVISGHANVAVIRSGQDWSDTKVAERKLYLEEIEPALRGWNGFSTRRGEILRMLLQ
jgi:hypothetical protein